MISEVIESNIPVPVTGWKSMLEQMEVGQSFAFDNAKRSSVANAVTVHFHKLNNKRFTIKADPENPETKSRVWRIEDKEDAA